MQQLFPVGNQAVRPQESESYQKYKYNNHISLRFRVYLLRQPWSRWRTVSTTHFPGLGNQTAMEGKLQKRCWAAGRASGATAYLRDLLRCHLWRFEDSSDHLIPDNARDKLDPQELFLFDQRFHEDKNQVAAAEQWMGITSMQMGFNPYRKEASRLFYFPYLINSSLVHSIHANQQV